MSKLPVTVVCATAELIAKPNIEPTKAVVISLLFMFITLFVSIRHNLHLLLIFDQLIEYFYNRKYFFVVKIQHKNSYFNWIIYILSLILFKN
jgi:hypothetical protein